ncbi:MAG: hypothetical protein PHV02_02580 [Rhodocyclaceae bacterium]|nr:hypothetical protein [Rhodocyclaceae bacterium]
MSNDANKGYKFNVQNGSITAVYEVEHGTTKLKQMDNDEIWRIDGQQVIKSEYDDGHQEITVYADTDGDGVFAEISKSYAPATSETSANPSTNWQKDIENDDVETGYEGASHDSDHSLSTFENSGREKYAFTVENNQITRVQELEHGFMQDKVLSSNEQYIVDTNNNVLKIETKSYGQEIVRYSDIDQDGLYAKISEDFVSNTPTPSSATENISSFLFYGSDGDDAIGLSTDGSATGGLGSDRFIFRELGHVEISDFDSSEGDQIVIDTGLGFKSLEHLAQYVTSVNYNGNDIDIEFGESVSITLIGTNPSTLSASDFSVLS